MYNIRNEARLGWKKPSLVSLLKTIIKKEVFHEMIITDTYRDNAKVMKEIVKNSFSLSSDSYKRFCEYVDDPMKLFNEDIRKIILDRKDEVVDFRVPISTKNLIEEEVPKEIYFVNEVLSNILFEFYKEYRTFDNGCSITPTQTVENKAIIFGKERKLWRFMISHAKKVAEVILKENESLSVVDYIKNDSFNIKHLFKFIAEYSRNNRDNLLNKRANEFFNKYSKETTDLSVATSIIEETFRLTADIMGSEIGSNKNTQKSFLSFNFFDWFLASTGENWSSCIDLTSNTCFSLGLIGLMSCPDWGMLMITKEKEKNVLGLKVPHILTRTWAIYSANRSFRLVNWYPHEIRGQISDGYVYDEGGIKITSSRSEEVSRSFSWYEPFYMRNGMVPFIYADNYSVVTSKSGNSIRFSLDGDRAGIPNICRDSNGEFRRSSGYSFGGLAETLSNRFNIFACIEREIDALDNYENDTDDWHYCSCCEDSFDDDYLIYVDGYGYYCDSCFDENFHVCSDCGRYIYIHTDDYESTEDDRIICQRCYERSYLVCEICESVVLARDSVCMGPDGPYICQTCADEECFTCYECGQVSLDAHRITKTLVNRSGELEVRDFCGEGCAETFCNINGYTIVDDVKRLEGFIGGKEKEESCDSQVS